MLSRIARWWRERSQPRQTNLPEAFVTALEELGRRFEREGIDFALIGGVALVLHGIERATKDIDLIVARETAERADALLLSMGFERLHRTATFGNYLLYPLRVDLLYTKGEHSRRMLAEAPVVSLHNAERKVVAPEHLIGLKLQALANNPARHQDWVDIENLLRRHIDTLELTLVRDYFILFGREADLDALLEAVRAGGP